MLRRLTVTGEPYAHGREVGVQLGRDIRAFLDADRDAAALRLLRPPRDLHAPAAAFGPWLAAAAPELWADVQGLAAGAGISLDEALYLQYRREVLREHLGATSPDCSLFAVRHARWGPVLGQTIDLEPHLRPFGVVLRTRPWEGRPAHVQYTFAGLLGYAGLNDRGLCVGINMVDGGTWGLGLSPYLLVRRLLDAPDFETARARLHDDRLSSSRCITLLGEGSAVCVERLPDGAGELPGLPHTHTNHFEHPTLLAEENSHPFVRAKSRKRQACLAQKLDALATAPDIAAVRALLADHADHPDGLCFHAAGKPYRNETVAAVVMVPQAGRLYALQGAPCEQTFAAFDLESAPCFAS